MRYSGAVQRKLVNHHKGLAAAIIVFGVSAVYPIARQLPFGWAIGILVLSDIHRAYRSRRSSSTFLTDVALPWTEFGRLAAGMVAGGGQYRRNISGHMAGLQAWLALNVARAAMQLVDSAAGHATYRQSARTRVTSAFGIWLSPLVRPPTIRCPRSQACACSKKMSPSPWKNSFKTIPESRLRSKIWQLALTMPNQPRKPMLFDAKKRGVVVIRPKARSGSRKIPSWCSAV